MLPDLSPVYLIIKIIIASTASLSDTLILCSVKKAYMVNNYEIRSKLLLPVFFVCFFLLGMLCGIHIPSKKRKENMLQIIKALFHPCVPQISKVPSSFSMLLT